jgi:hypothetical protein
VDQTERKSALIRDSRLLMQLRELLGESGKPIRVEEFSQITGISIHTVYAVEDRRRPLSDSLLERIRLATSAALVGDKWEFAYEPGVPFSREIFRTFTSRVLITPYQLDLDSHAAALRLLGLLREAKLEHYQALLFNLHTALEKLEEEYGNKATKEIFDATKISIGINREVSTNELGFVSREYRWIHSTKGGKVTEEVRIEGQQGGLPRRDFMLDFRELRRADHYSPPSPRREYEEHDAEIKRQQQSSIQTPLRSRARKKAARSNKLEPVPVTPQRSNDST